jgi:serine/threonine protein phosphatase PrpC
MMRPLARYNYSLRRKISRQIPALPCGDDPKGESAVAEIHGAGEWVLISGSVKGASHVTHGIPNQDACFTRILRDGAAVIAAVADGHGGPRSFRSHIGSRLAVQTAVDVCEQFLDDLADARPSAIKDACERLLFDRILQSWRERVQSHFRCEGFSDEELDRLESREGARAREKAVDPDQLFVAYGATLLLAALTPAFMIAVQLGDGRIVVTDPAGGEVGYVVPPPPEDSIDEVNKTASLCDSDASKEAACRYVPFGNGIPAMVMLSTDGYWNSYTKPYTSFPKVVADYALALRERGHAYVQANLNDWLDHVSRTGVCDDTTVVLMHHLQPPVPAGRPEKPERTFPRDSEPVTPSQCVAGLENAPTVASSDATAAVEPHCGLQDEPPCDGSAAVASAADAQNAILLAASSDLGVKSGVSRTSERFAVDKTGQRRSVFPIAAIPGGVVLAVSSALLAAGDHVAWRQVRSATAFARTQGIAIDSFPMAILLVATLVGVTCLLAACILAELRRNLRTRRDVVRITVKNDDA